MPTLGFDMEEGTILQWHKEIGDVVALGDIIVEVEAEKATVEVEALDSGLLTEIVHEAGAVVRVGDVIGCLND
jgi:pyruvate/2-oxoglutarate dehydrogenase complex dihydrolipoamide acyltransferase (E2) component